MTRKPINSSVVWFFTFLLMHNKCKQSWSGIHCGKSLFFRVFFLHRHVEAAAASVFFFFFAGTTTTWDGHQIRTEDGAPPAKTHMDWVKNLLNSCSFQMEAHSQWRKPFESWKRQLKTKHLGGESPFGVGFITARPRRTNSKEREAHTKLTKNRGGREGVPVSFWFIWPVGHKRRRKKGQWLQYCHLCFDPKVLFQLLDT